MCTLHRYSASASRGNRHRWSSIILLSATATTTTRGKRHHACPYSPAPSVPRNHPMEILTVRRPASSASRCILTLVAHSTGHPCSRLLTCDSVILPPISSIHHEEAASETCSFNSAVRGTGSVDKVRASVCARPECFLTGRKNERRWDYRSIDKLMLFHLERHLNFEE